jgi:hypothetical protein
MRLIAALMLALTVFATAPGPARAQEVLGTISAEHGVNLAGTRWQGTVDWSSGEHRQWTLHFRPDGVLEYGYDGNTYDNGRWLQNDSVVVMHTNTYFAVLVGTVQADSIRGHNYNRRAANGEFSFTPQGNTRAK